MAKVNLDSLIMREDFEVLDDESRGTKANTISIQDLEMERHLYNCLRKPDFQRETSEWTPSKVCSVIESFLNGDLIPALILWRSPSGLLFVIDGSHRLSALIAWIQDDYGDGKVSKDFYENRIPDEQVKVAESARKLIRKNIGSYADFKLAATRPDKVAASIAQHAKLLGSQAIQVQWVEGDAKKAESSFFKINQQAAPINDTELTLLKSRAKPNCIAARAIVRSGKGHKYWSRFSTENQRRVEDLAGEINKVLFEPTLETPVKTLDVPIGGRSYSAQTLPLVLTFVNLVNAITPSTKLDDDVDGATTIEFLEKVRKVCLRINSNHASSLGLHPALYFYSQEGRHKIASFYATVAFIMTLEEQNRLREFIKVRREFEVLIRKHDYLIQQIVRKYRGAEASVPYIQDFFLRIVAELSSGDAIDLVLDRIAKLPEFSYLTMTPEEDTGAASINFSPSKKSAVFLNQSLTSANTCGICGGLIHKHAITIDHVQRKRDGGVGEVDNGQLAHPFCNSTVKN